MAPTPCPTCGKSNLVRCKILRLTDPDCGREYEACSICKSKWFLDDPERPTPDPDAKPKKSIWEKLGSWGAPNTGKDSSGHLRAATYFFPPAHEYPQVVFPIPDIPRASFLVAPAPPPPEPEPQAEPEPQPEPEVAPQEEEPQPEPELPPPPPPAEIVAVEPEPAPEPPPPPESEVVLDPTPPLTELVPASPAAKSLKEEINDEERERYEMLMKIAKSPVLSIKNEEQVPTPPPPPPIEPERLPSPVPTQPPPSEPTLTPEEEELRQKLLDVVASPRPETPVALATRALSPELLAIQTAQASLELEEDREIAAYAKRIANRLDELIQTSPFIKKDGLATPRTTIAASSPRRSLPSSPLPRKSPTNPPLASRPSSRASNPRSIARLDEDEVLSIPGTFPTPKPEPLTSKALDQLNQQSSRGSRSSVGTRSVTVQTSKFPAAPVHVSVGHKASSRRSEKVGTEGSQRRARFSSLGLAESPLFS